MPRRYVAFSPCYRKEAGSYGKDTRGIIRVHWFDKVEMFTYTTIEESYAEHQRLLAWEKEFLDKLELAYRVIDTAAGDLGLSAQRKFDCEAWIPTQGKYRELTSTSNCTDFQARRLGIRGRFGDQVTPVATLNGTLMASTRTIVAILETHQQADGSVTVPKALRPYLQDRETLGPGEPGQVTGPPGLVALDIDGTLVDYAEVASAAGAGRGPGRGGCRGSGGARHRALGVRRASGDRGVRPARRVRGGQQRRRGLLVLTRSRSSRP